MISHPTHPTWPAHDPDIKELFGFQRKQKWPDEGLPTRLIQGAVCWVNPLPAKLEGTKYRPFKLRAMCLCPQCGTELPIGRLAQHEGTKTCTQKAKV